MLETLRRTVRKIILESNQPFPRMSPQGRTALTSLCEQYFNARAGGVNSLGNLGEQIALVVLGLSTSDDWRNTQDDPHSTNQWSNSFPMIDVMTQPLSRTNPTPLPQTAFYSVKTGGSTQNWRSLHRVPNLFTQMGQKKGIRDILEAEWQGNDPEQLTLHFGLIHVQRVATGVQITQYRPVPITWKRTSLDVISAFRSIPMSWGRGHNLSRALSRTMYYEPQISPSGSNPRNFWKTIQEQVVIPCQANQQLAQQMAAREPTRRSMANRGRWGSHPLLRRLNRLQGDEFYQEWGNHMQLEDMFQQSWHRWANSLRRNGMQVPSQSPTIGQERDAQ